MPEKKTAEKLGMSVSDYRRAHRLVKERAKLVHGRYFRKCLEEGNELPRYYPKSYGLIGVKSIEHRVEEENRIYFDYLNWRFNRKYTKERKDIL